ncbi:hypothetical protein D3C72_2374110 [compost metagenome]
MRPDAPERLSTMTLCPNSFAQASEIRRAAMSTLPPGANGTISVTARSGKALLAPAAWAQQDAATAAHNAPANLAIFISGLLVWPRGAALYR